tara:strand:+ start:3457 stop:3891 length:435 start_codon:yes stop_codon:yes gene_type:complete
VNACPQCNYETTGPKSALQAHIWSKHTPEHERPFQCPCGTCEKGFSARANLNKHIVKQHEIVMPKKINKQTLIYKITVNKKICKDAEMKKRLDYYKENPVIIINSLPINQDDINISYDALHYDDGSNMIRIEPYDRCKLLNLYN